MSLALVLDEMHSPVVAEALRTRGHDVVSVAESPELRGLTDAELFTWASRAGRRIVTENVRDFRPLGRRAQEAGSPGSGLLLTSSRTVPRSRRNPGTLIDALDAWLTAPSAAQRPAEDWLMPAPSGGSRP